MTAPLVLGASNPVVRTPKLQITCGSAPDPLNLRSTRSRVSWSVNAVTTDDVRPLRASTDETRCAWRTLAANTMMRRCRVARSSIVRMTSMFLA